MKAPVASLSVSFTTPAAGPPMPVARTTALSATGEPATVAVVPETRRPATATLLGVTVRDAMFGVPAAATTPVSASGARKPPAATEMLRRYVPGATEIRIRLPLNATLLPRPVAWSFTKAVPAIDDASSSVSGTVAAPVPGFTNVRSITAEAGVRTMSVSDVVTFEATVPITAPPASTAAPRGTTAATSYRPAGTASENTPLSSVVAGVTMASPSRRAWTVIPATTSPVVRRTVPERRPSVRRRAGKSVGVISVVWPLTTRTLTSSGAAKVVSSGVTVRT